MPNELTTERTDEQTTCDEQTDYYGDGRKNYKRRTDTFTKDSHLFLLKVGPTTLYKEMDRHCLRESGDGQSFIAISARHTHS